MAAPGGARTGVARMLRAFVVQIQRERRQPFKPLAYGHLDRVHHWGKALRKGFTVTLPYTPAAQ